MKKHISMGLFGLLLLGSSLAACDGGGDDEATPPQPLSADVFQLETGLFDRRTAPKTEIGLNFTVAALRVWPTSLLLGAHLIVPISVTGAALEAEAVQQGDAWSWTATTASEGHDVAFRLSATPDRGELAWSMRISYTDTATGAVVEDFELYTARTDLAGETGSWQLYSRTDGTPRVVLSAEFERHGETERVTTFRVPDTAARNAGDSIRYEHHGDDRVFFWRQAEEGLEHLVTWNTVTRAGSITATNYRDGQPSCWDENLDDDVC